MLISLAALNEALTAEIQRLKMATGEINAESMSKCFGQQLFVNPQMYQQQQQPQSGPTNPSKLQQPIAQQEQPTAQDSNSTSTKSESKQ